MFSPALPDSALSAQDIHTMDLHLVSLPPDNYAYLLRD